VHTSGTNTNFANLVTNGNFKSDSLVGSHGGMTPDGWVQAGEHVHVRRPSTNDAVVEPKSYGKYFKAKESVHRVLWKAL
jgi:hypothetical protein